MGIELILGMAQGAHPGRRALGTISGGLDFAQLDATAMGGAQVIRGYDAEHLVFLGVNSTAFPVAIMAATYAEVPIVPLNYRLTGSQLVSQIRTVAKPFVIVDEAFRSVVEQIGVDYMLTDDFLLAAVAHAASGPIFVPDDSVAVVLFTSGTTATPKAVLLRHQHLLSYLMQTVEFGSAAETDATLVSTPPYHIAGVGAVLSNLYAGRRLVYLPDFSPAAWLETVRREEVTNVMLVPTMLARIVEHLGGRPAETPSLRQIAYGGARMPEPVLLDALAAFPDAGFVNAYGLTETSSTIAVLGPDEHRAALADPSLRQTLASAGKAVPGVEFQVRDSDDTVLDVGEIGLLWVRGSQISGEYMGMDSVLDAEGWFPTRDRAWIENGYLYLGGRADDTIIRGGENIAPAEIEAALVHHPAVREVAVIGLPDDEWGERIVAVIIPTTQQHPDQEGIRAWCRERLRGSRTPDEVRFVEDLPRTDTGKLVRRSLVQQLTVSGAEDQVST